MRRRTWAVMACIAAMIGVMSCSSDDEVVAIPPTAQAEAAIESVLTDVIAPLADFIDGMVESILAGQPKAPSIVCPDLTGACSSGDVTCDEDSSGISLAFDFNQCNVGGPMVVADGGIDFTPTGTLSAMLQLFGFSLDGGDPMSGTISIDLGVCSQNWLIDAGSAAIQASVVQCDQDQYPSGQSGMQITVVSGSSTWFFVFSFDGSNTASVWGTLNDAPAVFCDVDLDTFATTCWDYDSI